MNIGIIGMGKAGSRHASNAHNLGHSVHWFDPGIPEIDSHYAWLRVGAERCIKDVDAIVIASPTDTHAEYLHRAILAGKPVLVEKPIGALGTSAQVATSLSLAAKNRIPVATGFNLRYHPNTDFLKGGGPFYGSFICSQYTEHTADGVINHWASHEIDLARYILGNLRLLDCHIGNDEAVDLTLINWETGARAHIHSDMLAHDRFRRAILICRDSYANINLDDPPVDELQYQDMLEDFLEWVKSKSQPSHLATGWDGYETLKICEQAAALNVQRDS